MKTAKFTKMCKDCKLYNKSFKQTNTSLVFAASKTKGAQFLTFDEFLNKAIPKISGQRAPGKSKEDIPKVVKKICGGKTKTTGVTKVEPQSDSINASCGVYARGGGDNKSKDTSDLASIADRDVKTDARGVPIQKKS